ncbi:hypothetical protein ACTFQF_00385 [Aliivibrio fischeri]|uniref:Uncharacterized protein n=1 Tax=Aliivibrio fischeri (strain MJ11) TaxID=388396 RepID=B5EVY2_ALIFM|nr:hypothetical protein [Aliivibrio fischeri]ACH64722.1 hypothetical protein VFMJ11_B0039 [Aliivibrio fischeri MJ11]
MGEYNAMQKDVLSRLVTANQRGVTALALSDLIMLLKSKRGNNLKPCYVKNACQVLLEEGLLLHKFLVYESFYSLSSKGINTALSLRLHE